MQIQPLCNANSALIATCVLLPHLSLSHFLSLSQNETTITLSATMVVRLFCRRRRCEKHSVRLNYRDVSSEGPGVAPGGTLASGTKGWSSLVKSRR